MQLLKQFGMTALTGGVGGPSVTTYPNGTLTINYTNADFSALISSKYFPDKPLNTYAGGAITGTAVRFDSNISGILFVVTEPFVLDYR